MITSTPPDYLAMVSVIALIATKPVGGGGELMSFYLIPENWEYTRDLGLIACCLQNDVQRLKHGQTLPHLCTNICRNRRTQPCQLVCATEMSDLNESLITWQPGCLDSRDE